MELESSVPPGFRFHPTEEELVGYYLTRKIASQKIDLQVITDIDLYRIEPWDLQERCKLRYEEQTEWYFFSHKDKKYPTGSRTNRATGAGFWKATGRDKAVLSKHKKIIGMRKTLVFYKGRAPNGRKTDWIMHEYRLQTTEHAPPQDEGWVVCRAFMKQSPNQRQSVDTWNPAYYSREHDHTAGIQAIAHVINPTQLLDPYQRFNFHEQSPSCSDQFVTKQTPFNGLIELPQLDSPTLPTSLVTKECPERSVTSNEESSNYGVQFVDWRSLDQLLTSQFSDVDVPLYSNSNLPLTPLDYDTSDAQNQENCFVATFPSS